MLRFQKKLLKLCQEWVTTLSIDELYWWTTGDTNRFKGLQTLYQKYLPKADPLLIINLLMREQEKDLTFDPVSTSSYYTVEMSTNDETESERFGMWYTEKLGYFLCYVTTAPFIY